MGKILILSVTDHEEHILNKIMETIAEKNIYKFDKRQSTLPQIDYLQF